jgi:CubicO group peptidase (beta-lactamase class C family)
MRLFSAIAALAGAVLMAAPSLAQQPGPALTPTQPKPLTADVSATPPPPPAGTGRLNAQDLEAWLDGYMPYALERGDVAGAVVVVVKDGQVLLEKGYGYADVKTRRPVDPKTTLFRPGSVSKLFTWTAVMQLVEQGKLNLDADVNQYLDFKIPPRDGKPVTLRNIMTHTAGFEEQVKGLITTEAPDPLGVHLKHWVPHRIFAPGTTPAYSNYATAVAGYIVARTSGMSFDDYIERNIFARLGMQHSSFRQPLPKPLLANMAKGYQLASSGEAKPYEFVSLYPAGSLALTGDDMSKFMIAHLNNGGPLLKPETAHLMHDTPLTIIPGVNRMLLGFYEQNRNGHRSIGHGGDTQWFHSDMHLFIDDGIGLFISMNSVGKDGAVGPIREHFADGFADRYLPPVNPPAVTKVDAKTAAEHAKMIAGTYVNSRRTDSSYLHLLDLMGQVKVIVNKDGTISVSMLKGIDSALKKFEEISPFLWQEVNGQAKLGAEVKDGEVVRFTGDEISPFMMFDRVSPARDAGWMLPGLIAALAALALTGILWPVAVLARRKYRGEFALSGKEARAYRWVRIAALASVAVMAGWMITIVKMFDDFSLLAGGLDPLVWVLHIASIVVFIGAVLIAAWNAWLVWTHKRGWFAKLWSAVLVLSTLIVLYVAWIYHLIGFSINF